MSTEGKLTNMCFGSMMSKTTKDLTAKTVDLANTMANQAKKVFGAADTTFNTISNALTPIVNGGPSQFGFSNGQFTAMNAAAVNAGATEKRNLTAQAAVSGQPFNAARIDQDAANKTATQLNKNIQAGYQQGNQNFWQATSNLGKAPSIYETAEGFDKNAMGALDQATKAQENRDAAGGGWKNLAKTGLAIAGDIGGSFIGDPGLGGQVMSVADAASGGGGGGKSATSSLFGSFADGAGNLDTTGGSSFGEQLNNFFTGMGNG